MPIHPRHMPAQPQDIPTADIWARLTPYQRAALILAPRPGLVGATASTLRVHPRTLESLTDPWRVHRGLAPPIMLVAWEPDYNGRRYWYRTKLGHAVAAEAR